jgi:hypothetical protein
VGTVAGVGYAVLLRRVPAEGEKEKEEEAKKADVRGVADGVSRETRSSGTL